MRLIRSVEIERFRSLDSARLTELSDFTVLVGPNNSGKSNVLRALNLFFNNYTDPDQFVDFAIDYHVGAPKKKKRLIRVAVEFDVPDLFKYRSELDAVRAYLGKRFWVRKIYSLDEFEPDIEMSWDGTSFQRPPEDDADKVRQFLDLISFRYVPNRAIPAVVIQEQSRGVLKNLATRIAISRGVEVSQIMASLQTSARIMLTAIAKDMSRWCPGITELELGTPTDLVDMLGPTGFRAWIGDSGHVPDTSLGAGAQSLLMFHILHLIDRSEAQRGFGWRQATVWGVEEPESSLHRELQLRLAALLQAYAEPGGRFQIIATTHNEVFVYGASSGFAFRLVDFRTRAEPRPVRELAEEAAAQRVTGPCPPVLKFPLDTVVLVEGRTDCRILERAAQLAGVGTHLRFSTVSQLDPSLRSDGKEQIKRFLSAHAASLSARLLQHPLLVLLDWDTSPGELREVQKKYGPSGPRYVSRMDEAQAEPRLDRSFKGIERFFSRRLIEQAMQQGMLPGIAQRMDGTLVVDRAELDAAKPRLADLFCDEAERADCEFLRHALQWAEGIRAGLLS